MTTLSRPITGHGLIYWVADNVIANDFPDVESALRDPDGLLAIGGDLKPERLLSAYRRGIFPWFSQGQPILWWSPDPRCVLRPDDLRVSRSLARTLRRRPLTVTFNRAFERVLRGCAAPRRATAETWITAEMAAAYTRLHTLGYGVSVECWDADGMLAGGLYGVAIGRVFFGESMFARVTDASKIAFWHAVRYLEAEGFTLIDCQLPSAHLEQFGAAGMPRREFLARLRELTEPTGEPGRWTLRFAARREEFLA
jgi:leucyl/phenylalanyl-tRNA--protein transferase